MGRDVVSHVSLNTMQRTKDSYDTLLLSTTGPREMKKYHYSELDKIREDFPDIADGKPSKIYRKASQFFNQGKTTFAESLFSKIKIVGIDPPTNPADLIDSLESIRMNDDEFYAILTDLDDKESVKALMAYAEASEPTLAEQEIGIEDHRKFYFGQTNDKEFFHEGNSRSIIVFVNDLEEEGDAAYLGNVGPSYPIRMTWKFKRPQGISIADLSEGEKEVLDENKINYMALEYGKYQYMKQGVCGNGEFIDVQISADFAAFKIRDRVYEILTSNADVPYNNDGFALICSGVSDALETCANNNIVDRDPESNQALFEIDRPTLDNASVDQRKSRVMPPIYWEAQIQGSVHKVSVRGVLSVSLQMQAE